MKKYWKELKVWAKAHEVVKTIYKVTITFPKDEIYGMTSQIRRAGVSIPTNIVEGNSRKTTKDYVHFLYISRGSLEEVRYLLLLSQEVGFLKMDVYESLEQDCVEISMMLNAMITKLEAKL